MELYETVNVTLTQVRGYDTDLIGTTITITDVESQETLYSTTWNGTTVTYNIPTSTSYKVEVGSVTGYKVSINSYSYVAGIGKTRNLSFQYGTLGIYIESTDHQLYTKEQWSSAGKTVNAIVVIAEKTQFRLHPSIDAVDKPYHSNNTDPISAYLPMKGRSEDYDGEGNTDKLILFNDTYGTNNTNYIAPYCRSITFADGITKGMLLSSWQTVVVKQNKTAISECLTACGGTAMYDYYWKTSTLYNATSFVDVNNIMTSEVFTERGYQPRVAAPY